MAWVDWGVAMAATVAAVAAAYGLRYWRGPEPPKASLRQVEAERVLAMLSSRQPGVWDLDDLRERVVERAKACWASTSLDELSRLETWVSPQLLAELKRWPAGAKRREVKLKLEEPPAFVAVTEGGAGPDRCVAKLVAGWEASYLDEGGARVKWERQPLAPSYHTWLHVDGQGWLLEAMSPEAPSELPVTSVLLRVQPRAGALDEGPR